MSEKTPECRIIPVGGKPVKFSKRSIRGRFLLEVPADFAEDKNLVSNYTYLFSKDKSPLSIAIKDLSYVTTKDREWQVAHYFNQAPETLNSFTHESGSVYYRETVTGSSMISVYSLRFVIDIPNTLLFGCFNCSADYRDDWRDIVLNALQNIEAI